MATTPILTLALLETAARKAPGSLTENAYAVFVVQEASAVVTDKARHPEWEDDASPVAAPREAVRVAVAVAVRALLNPELETSYNVGPLGARSRDEWAYGFQLTPYELDELEALQGGGPGSKTGLWVQPLAQPEETLIQHYVHDPWWPSSTPILYQDDGDVGTDPLPDGS